LVSVLLKSSNQVALSCHLLGQRILFVAKSAGAHLQILHNENQVLVHSGEEFDFLLHLGGLLIQRLNGALSGLDFTLELLDFVVQHELELLKLLRLLLQLLDSFLLIIDRVVTLSQLTVFTLDVRPNLVGIDLQSAQLFVVQKNLLLLLLLLGSETSELGNDKGQRRFLFHSLVNLTSELILLPLLKTVNSLPTIVLDILAHTLMLSYHLLNLGGK